MANRNDIQLSIDNSRLATRLSIIGGITALVLLVLCVVLGAFRGGDVFSLGVIPYSLALLFAFATMIYGMLSTSAGLEAEEKVLLAKRKDTKALDVEEDVRFTAERSFTNYRRYAPYVLAVFAAVVVGALLVSTYSLWDGREVQISLRGNAVHSALIAAVMMLVSVLAGAFFVGQSRVPAFRWLRPVGAWLIAGFAVMAAAAVTSLTHSNNLLTVDHTVALVIFWILAVLGCEFIVSFIIEFYRPRTLRETRPIFESRLLALFTEPGGVMRNIASALDYQFGFKVSATWLYSAMERAFFPLVIVWLLIFWGFTMMHEVGPSEVGVREQLGRVTSQDLRPGIYWTLPWPFGRMRTFSCTEIKQLVVGEFAVTADRRDATEQVDDGHGHATAETPTTQEKAKQVVLWTESHGDEDSNFLVAVPQEPGASGKEESASVSLIRMSIPIQYRIRPDGVMLYGYANANPVKTLMKIGEQAATEYLASSSMMEVMSSHRLQAQEIMLKRIQELADEHHLGVEIVAVAILDAHPPTETVAPAYQSVIGALEQRETSILEAEAYVALTRPEAEAAANEIIANADSYRYEVKTVAAAESARFGAQLAAYQVMPGMFKLKSFLEFLEEDCVDMRKFVVSSDLDDEIYQFNFEQKERLDLVDTDITTFNQN